jgi:hypothetical protein
MSSKSAAYPTIVLTESEMFRNSKGEVCEVEVRGERTWNGCYFRAIDIGRVFGVKRLSHDLTNVKSCYNVGEDYVTLPNGGNSTVGWDSIYFTYLGLSRWLCRSHNKETRHYLEWMMKTLFTVQFGTMESKQQLAEEITDPKYKIFKTFSLVCAHNVSGVYLFRVKVLDSKTAVYKFGRSNDIKRRFYQHTVTYGEDNVELTQFTAVDECMLVAAERDVKNMLAEFKYEDGGALELVKLTNKQLKEAKLVYKIIHKNYETNTVKQELKQEVEESKQEVEKTRIIAVREYETATQLYTNHLETLQQENQDLKNTIREYESKMTKMREGFKVQMSKLRDEARLYMDSIKGVMDMFF